MPWSNNGTVQVSSGGTIATGTGTTFLSSARVGDALTIAGSTSLHEVTAIASDTQLTFQPPYTGTTGSGKAYRIAPIMGYDKNLSDAFNSIRLQWGTQLSSLQPWATAATADIALSNLGGSQTGTAVFKGSPAAGRAALALGNAATRTVQTSPTDTTDGALMAVGAFGLGTNSAQTATGDVNGLRLGGIFAPVSQANTPTTECVIWSGGRANGARAAQFAIDHGLIPKAWVRGYNGGRTAGTEWGSWYELYHRGNIVGTVSQTSNIPTGAVIERGSNANGEYVKFADGTMMCFFVKPVGLLTQSAYNQRRYTWPATFAVAPTVSVSIAGGLGTAGEWITLSAEDSSTSGFICVLLTSSTIASPSLYVIATGRWY